MIGNFKLEIGIKFSIVPEATRKSAYLENMAEYRKRCINQETTF